MESDALLPSKGHLPRGDRGRGRGLMRASTPSSISAAGGRGIGGAIENGADGGGDGGGDGIESLSSGSRRKPPPPLLTRQEGAHSSHHFWEAAEVATAISRDLVARAERWKLLAGEPLIPIWAQPGEGGEALLPDVNPLVARDVDKHEVASIYVKDALAGRDGSASIHDRRSLRALKLVRNKAWNQLLNVCTLLHLALPLIEIPRCLPCLGFQKVPNTVDMYSLHEGWRPTALGTTWMECCLCLLYIYDLHKENRSRRGFITARDLEGEGSDAKERLVEIYAKKKSPLPPWQRARTVMVTLISLGLLTNITSHYILDFTWHSWSRMILPFLFISRRTYLKHFVAGIIRVLPRMLPVAFLISFFVFFYGFLGYIVYRHQPRVSPILADIDLFGEVTDSALTFLRIFTARSYMLDVEVIFGGRKDIQVMVLSYAVIMVMFLGALIPAVANRNFQNQSRESYIWVKEQRKLALTRAFNLLKRPDGTVSRDDWVHLMKCLRPDCNEEHTSALFGAAKKAELVAVGKKVDDRQSPQAMVGAPSPAAEDASNDRNRLSRTGFFMLCALGTANFSQGGSEREKLYRNRRSGGLWVKIRLGLDAVFRWSWPGSNFPLSHQILNLALLLHGYQLIREGDDPEDRPAWAYPLGCGLITYFTTQAFLRIVAEGFFDYMREWRHVLGMVLNVVGIAYYTGCWPPGEVYHSLYQIIQASRLIVLWNVLHLMGNTTSEVARRLEFVFPSVLRASVVLFSVTYSYSVVAYSLFCATPMGQEPIDSVQTHSMVQRFAAVKEVASFGSLHQSFASLLYVIMLSNWPLFMDAAGDVYNLILARTFFYSFKVLTFYIVMPLTIGFIVQSYMAAQMPGSDAGTPAFSNTATRKRTGSGGDTLGASRRSTASRGGATGDDKGGKISPKQGSTPRVDSARGGSIYGYSTLADGAKKEIDPSTLVEDFSDSEDDAGEVGSASSSDDDLNDSSEEDDTSAPVMVASRNRSMSQQFWGLEQMKDITAAQQDSSVMQGTVDRLEADNSTLKDENARLRAMLESKTIAPGAATATPALTPSGILTSASSRGRTYSSDLAARGMQPIEEADDEEKGGGAGV